MIKPQQFTAKLADKIILNEKFVQYSFELIQPNTMEFEAGQYISLALPQGNLRRSYSICSAPSNTHGFELLIDQGPNGPGCLYLQSLKFGEEIRFLSPLGLFTIKEPTAPIILVATGSGIAPMRSMLLDLLQTKSSQQAILLQWGMRHEADLFWLEEFSELSDQFPNFRFHPVISQPTPKWPLCRGRVTDCLSVHDLVPTAQYYLCGNSQMLDDVMNVLIKRGVAQQNLHHEKFH
jgi:Na+-transporting NADH:ubiquinone oxidoreductase subunit F